MDSIAVSIIIPVYNTEKYLKECLKSCINQTLKKVEIICIDDGSTDRSFEILSYFQEKNSNIIILRQANQGAGIARNIGIKYARGEYIAFIDADDYYIDNNVLKKLYETAKEKEVNACGGVGLKLQDGKVQYVENSINALKKRGEIFYKDYQQTGPYTQFIYNRNFLNKNNIVFPEYRRYQDPVFFVRVMSQMKKFYVIDEPVYVIRSADKIIRYSNPEILKGLLSGMNDILCISKDEGFVKLHANIVQSLLKSYIEYVYVALYRRDIIIEKTYEELLANIDESILSKDSRKLSKSMFLSKNEIYEMVIRIDDNGERLVKKIELFDNILIYGAGMAGRCLCEYILYQGYSGKIEFVVSAKEPQYVVYGKKVISIYDIKENKNDILMLIANKDNAELMKSTASELGFRNIIIVPYREIKILSAEISKNDYVSIF